jgi:hypothetical protein
MSDVVFLDQFRRVRPVAEQPYDLDQLSERARKTLAKIPSVTTADRNKRCQKWRIALAQLEYFSALRGLTNALTVASAVGLWRDGKAPSLQGVDAA